MKTEKIMCAAIYLPCDITQAHKPTNIENGIVICGYRHCDCFVTLSLMSDEIQEVKKRTKIVQGFLTNNKRFVDRIEGKIIARNANQLLSNCSNSDELYSEDMWLIGYEGD